MNVQRLPLTKVARLVTYVLNLLYRVTAKKNPFWIELLDPTCQAVQYQIAVLERKAYSDADIHESEFEGIHYTNSFRFGLTTEDEVHVGVYSRLTGALVGYMAFFQPTSGQHEDQYPGEFLFPACHDKWLELGSPEWPVLVYRKLMRDPKYSRSLFKAGALRVPLAVITIMMSALSKTPWLLLTRAQPDSVRVLRRGIDEVFYDADWLVDEPIEGAMAHITLCTFPTFRHRKDGLTRLTYAFNGIFSFARLFSKKRRQRHQSKINMAAES